MQFSITVWEEPGAGAGGSGETIADALLMARSQALIQLEQMTAQRDAQVNIIAAIDGTLAALGVSPTVEAVT